MFVVSFFGRHFKYGWLILLSDVLNQNCSSVEWMYSDEAPPQITATIRFDAVTTGENLQCLSFNKIFSLKI